ncbi:fimbria/pilus outer membrane usher protein [Luteibacter aegosomaticola]|uniref:fimbria/pilus outer membrane usher protein n=1 Tax=Luteibacter aegosomaticola TaxID=2911538 RepID=UPI001FF81D7A|nr:fimbria/pilus outer membrane usher protein [Luteibacter aegosomaticola]UPG89784.1 fimbria/pilus outer membrane usher protein [Luteibacter aegosomaticola]
MHALDHATDAIPPPTMDPRMGVDGEDLYLEVVLNGTATERLMHFIRRGEALCAKAADLRGLGFVLPPGDEMRCLLDIQGLRYSYDAGQQRVTIDVPNGKLDLPRRVLNQPERAATKATSGTGLLLNYDIYAAHGDGLGNVSGLAELRAFSENMGVLSNTSLTRRYQETGGGWRGDTVRLDTQWRLSFPDKSMVLTVGDTFTGYTSWSRATRIGGIALGTDFALQPYRVTTPLPQFFGEATAPSSVELYVDGIRQYSGKVPSGPFQLTAVPGVDQSGQAQVVLTDALGRTSTVTFPFYAARQLLRTGLDDWSFELGTVREAYGINSFEYGDDPVGSATWRRGMTDQLTLESHAEAGAGRGVAGMGAVWNAFGASVVNASYAASHGGGAQYGAGISWSGRYMNFSVDTLRSNASYRDVASSYGSPPPRASDRALIGFNVRESSFGANYVRLRYGGQPTTRYVGLFVLRNLTRGISVNASMNQNLDEHADRSFFVGVTWALDERTTYTTSAQRDRTETFGTIDANHPIDGDGGFGWHVQGRSGDAAGGLGEVGWLGNHGQLTMGVSTIGPSSYSYADANGALVLMGGHVFTARRIDDAFALVSTEGAPDIPVLLENRRTGVTDSNGLLLVSRLNAWQDNRLAIDPIDLPADERVQRVDSVVAPADRSGVLVRFPVKRVRAALAILVNVDGTPIPLGSTVETGSGEPAIVGYDGQAYLDNLKGSTNLMVTLPDGTRCTAALTYPEHARDLPELGPLTCRPSP